MCYLHLQGFGVFWSKTGDRYEGEWLQGRRHGQGRQTYGGRFPDGFGGDVYEGDWVQDKRDGHGVMQMANGDCFEGEWAGDLKHGRGTFFYQLHGGVYEGIWAEGVAKCGEYSNKADVGQGPRFLPDLQLQHPEEVLTEAVAQALGAAAGASSMLAFGEDDGDF